MKSKLFLMMSTLVVALTMTAAANAQTGRTDKLVAPEKVALPCSITETVKAANPAEGKPKTIYLTVKTSNNTGSWLAEGKTIHFNWTTYSTFSSGTMTFVESKVLDGMVPAGQAIVLMENKYPGTS